jgi:hypothetical protein
MLMYYAVWNLNNYNVFITVQLSVNIPAISLVFDLEKLKDSIYFKKKNVPKTGWMLWL